ncbi:saccharopine dehydrogenase NADP-binding domain-containing protein [Streptomyces silvisoli]|uniref:Saccharopine dehydrogenase NADP-binding domain-containing protein n=1 Tax=Streptomyces silvisoli TaxID=3034235 RepID=A0ABT5ZWT2_9ACTN|nr:saccharopine dehydrogenase NADP-binding domain-containing protein [Streptomyces silvisoli]MDF3294282.1 saccharopine dehydrogenase NADP-binding domain-containing protein [Streptomyces silvisoli]
MRSDFVVLGASGTTGGLIAGHLVRRGANVVLAGRDARRLGETAARLGSGTVSTVTVDLTDPDSLAAAVGAGRVLVNTVGPFARLAPPVVTACLDAGTAYLDLANERTAVRALLERDTEARKRGVALVTGAGFGPAATEALVLAILGRGVRPAAVAVASAATSAYDTEGVRSTVTEAVAEGATLYRAGELVHTPLGEGATTLTFGGAARTVIPVPVGDLEAARQASGAPDITAYAVPRGTGEPEDRSYGYAEITDEEGRSHVAELSTGEGFAFTAALAVETATRLLDAPVAGAWTAARLLGPELVASLPGTTIELGR